tara:strand:- start:1088 stop:1861 length:774 start_codon:yes stop_codon:yes gene_type:complete
MAAPFRTFLDLCNTLIREINEVELTSLNFTNAVGIQKFIKDTINRGYFDICNAEDKWSFLAVGDPSNNYYGNVNVETVSGTRWYKFNTSSTGVTTDYSFIDYENVTLTEEGVSGKDAPYEVRNLHPITTEFWTKHYAVSESVDKSDTQTFGIPQRIIRSPKNDGFGLSPIPNGVYKIYFFAYSQPSELTNHGDTVVFPQQYTTVLLSRARYYLHQFKDNISQSQLADAEYKKGLRTMREQLIESFPDSMIDDRIRIV